MQRQTMINNLPQPIDTRGAEQPDSQLVDEIFKGMNESGLYQRQMDESINVPQENSMQPTPEQIYQMQQVQQQQMEAVAQQQQAVQFMQAQPYQQQQPMQMNGLVDPSVAGTVKSGSADKFNLVSTVRTVAIFAVLFFLLSAPFITNLMVKIPFFAVPDTGALSISGLLVKSLVGGIIFAVIQFFL